MIGCFVFASHVHGEDTHDTTLAPYFFIDTPGIAHDAFPLKATTVTANVTGVMAKVTVHQRYSNTGRDPLHARYVFPASTRAAVHGMTITIGDQKVHAHIKKRDDAQHTFTAAKHEGKSAALLEQARPNVFTMQVANIMPGDDVDIELQYSELLIPTAGTYEFVYPAVVGPRYVGQQSSILKSLERWVRSPYLHDANPSQPTFEISVTLSTGMAIQTIACHTHTVEINWKNPSIASITLKDSTTFHGDRDFIVQYQLLGEDIQSGLSLYEGDEENFFLLMMQPPAHVTPHDIPAREYIFVLDVSGSMHGFPLNTAKTLITGLLRKLRPHDTFNLILFADSTRIFSPQSQPVTPETIAHVLHLIDHVEGGGGTELLPALERALTLPRTIQGARTVAIITDGYVHTESEIFGMITRHLAASNIFSFGIGSSVNRHLIEGMARVGLGIPFIVTRPETALRVAQQFQQYIASPLLTNLQLQTHGITLYDVEPPVLPNLLSERPVIVFGKWRGTRTGTLTLSGRGPHDTYTQQFAVAETVPRIENQALPHLWSRTRLQRISDLSIGEPTAEHVAEVTSLGLTYSLLTPYTSFVAVIEHLRNASHEGRDTDQPLPLPYGVSHYAVASEPSLWMVLFVLLLLLLCGEMARKRKGYCP